MNFVIFSYYFLPMAGAESYCATRFASALAEAGHHVTVVTMDWSQQVSASVYKLLVNSNVKIVRVPMKDVRGAPIISRMRYLTHEWSAINISNCISVLKEVLRGEDRPILISRTHPITSLIVAWHCRKLARKWVAHLSDPIPLDPGRLKRMLMRLWCRRAFRTADIISVTCNNAVRFYREEYGAAFGEVKCIVVPHIGDPWIAADELYPRVDNVQTIVHSGLFYAGRGAQSLLNAIKVLNETGCQCRLIQVGEVDSAIKDVFKSVKNVVQLDNLSPSLSAAVIESADVSFIADLQITGDYIPYMPSKFAYQIFTDKPLVIFSKIDSPMGSYCAKYPNAGLFFANSACPESLIMAIRDALASSRDRNFDRVALRRDFTKKAVIEKFLEVCS